MTEPLYRRIAQDLRQQIQDGELSPGAQLPTELELRERYEASRNTIRDAIKWLVSNGLVETRPGQGTFVVERIDPFMTTLSADPETGLGGGEGEAAFAEVRERGRAPSRNGPRVELQLATGNVAARLRVPDGTQVVRSLGLVQVGYRDRILVRAPDENEIRFFRLPDDGRISVIYLMRTSYQDSDEGPVPFRVTFTTLPADRNQLVINSGEVPTARAVAASP